MWITQTYNNDNLVHILPVEDIKSHTERGRYCHCKPRIEDNLVIHNAYDGREFQEVENERKRLSNGH